MHYHGTPVSAWSINFAWPPHCPPLMAEGDDAAAFHPADTSRPDHDHLSPGSVGIIDKLDLICPARQILRHLLRICGSASPYEAASVSRPRFSRKAPSGRLQRYTPRSRIICTLAFSDIGRLAKGLRYRRDPMIGLIRLGDTPGTFHSSSQNYRCPQSRRPAAPHVHPYTCVVECDDDICAKLKGTAQYRCREGIIHDERNAVFYAQCLAQPLDIQH